MEHTDSVKLAKVDIKELARSCLNHDANYWKSFSEEYLAATYAYHQSQGRALLYKFPDWQYFVLVLITLSPLFFLKKELLPLDFNMVMLVGAVAILAFLISAVVGAHVALVVNGYRLVPEHTTIMKYLQPLSDNPAGCARTYELVQQSQAAAKYRDDLVDNGRVLRTVDEQVMVELVRVEKEQLDQSSQQDKCKKLHKLM